MTEPRGGFDYDLGLRHCALKYVTMRVPDRTACKRYSLPNEHIVTITGHV
jgi:hypothetical protein